MADHRAPRKQRIRFDDQERERALEFLDEWLDGLSKTCPGMEAWDAIVLQGVKVADYLRRTTGMGGKPSKLEHMQGAQE